MSEETKTGTYAETDTFLRDVHDAGGIVSCFKRYGVVGVTGVLTKDECEATLGNMGMPPGCNIRDRSTYTMPEISTVLNRFGVIGGDVLWTDTILRNRCHPNVVRAYQVSLGSGVRTVVDLLFFRTAYGTLFRIGCLGGVCVAAGGVRDAGHCRVP